ncbi:hypothetical protein HC024_04110 [Methylococcaceae bacterium WWC4]|nr:hypothetical protein [Methylococcaceae bacterium WWC4]
MAKSDYIPHPDNDLLIWHDRFRINLQAKYTDLGISAADLATIEADNQDLHNKIAAASAATAAAKHATAEKSASRSHAEEHVRAVVRRIKANARYTDAIGNLLGVIGSENSVDLSSAKPILSGVDHSGGVVVLKYLKSKSNGINIYSQRENDADFIFLARNNGPAFTDDRPLLVPGKPELRRYTAVYVVNDEEVGLFSDEFVISCSP